MKLRVLSASGGRQDVSFLRARTLPKQDDISSVIQGTLTIRTPCLKVSICGVNLNLNWSLPNWEQL